jgi:hypothetical protein
LRLLICEHVTGAGFVGSSSPPSLAREGHMMVGVLVKALQRVDVGALDAA